MFGLLDNLSTSMSIRTKLLTAFASLAVLIGATGLSGVWFTSSVGDRATHIGEDLSPHTFASLEIQIKGTEAHLVFEEIMAGDQTEDIGQVWSLLEDAKWYANAVLNGGASEKGKFRATDSLQVREHMATVLATLDKFVETTKHRLALRDKLSKVCSGLEESFDDAYFKVQKGIDAITLAAVASPTMNSLRILRDAGQAKYLMANGHLFLEELIAGDSTESYESVKTDLDGGRKLIADLGGTEVASSLPPVIAAIDEFIGLADQRNANLTGGSQVGTKVETDYDNIYETFIKAASEAEDFTKSYVDSALADADSYKLISIYVLAAPWRREFFLPDSSLI